MPTGSDLPDDGSLTQACDLLQVLYGRHLAVAGELAANPDTACFLLNDAAEPGFPSFPVVRMTHLERFGALVPACFINQDADPFLHELYRHIDGVRMLPGVLVVNERGELSIFSWTLSFTFCMLHAHGCTHAT